MKTKILFFYLFFCLNIYSQSVFTIADGNHIVVEGSAEYIGFPMRTNYRYNYQESIYLQSEINYSGDITGICYKNNGGQAWSDNIKIFIGHDSNDEFINNSDWFNSNYLTEVFDGVFSVDATEGWYCINFQIPFNYNNTQNLIIGFYDYGIDYHSLSSQFYNKSVHPKYRTIYYKSDVFLPNPSSPPYADGTFYYVPNLQLSFGVPLPADNLMLKGVKKQNNNKLNWTSSSESNTQYHIIQRADGSGLFVDIDTLKAIGNSIVLNKYTYIDNRPLLLSYYRIKVVDNDGISTTFSNIISLNNDSNLEATLDISSNLISNMLKINLNSIEGSKENINIYNCLGERVVAIDDADLKSNRQNITIKFSIFDKGVYFVEYVNNEQKIIKRFVKN